MKIRWKKADGYGVRWSTDGNWYIAYRKLYTGRAFYELYYVRTEEEIRQFDTFDEAKAVAESMADGLPPTKKGRK
jgi:hypothetical protein